MAMTLRLRTEPDWVALVDGAAVLTRPPSAALVFTAEARARALYARLQEGVEVITMAGGRIANLPPTDTEEEAAGVRDALFALSLGELAILDWRNVHDEAGEPLAFEATKVAALMAHPAAAQSFLAHFLHPLNQVLAEGNA